MFAVCAVVWPVHGRVAVLSFCRRAGYSRATAAAAGRSSAVLGAQQLGCAARPGATFRDEPGDARSGVVAYERIFAGAGGQSRVELAVLAHDARALPLVPHIAHQLQHVRRGWIEGRP